MANEASDTMSALQAVGTEAAGVLVAALSVKSKGPFSACPHQPALSNHGFFLDRLRELKSAIAHFEELERKVYD